MSLTTRFSLLSEQDVLPERDALTFRHVTKDKLTSFAAIRQSMEPKPTQKLYCIKQRNHAKTGAGIFVNRLFSFLSDADRENPTI